MCQVQSKIFCSINIITLENFLLDTMFGRGWLVDSRGDFVSIWYVEVNSAEMVCYRYPNSTFEAFPIKLLWNTTARYFAWPGPGFFNKYGRFFIHIVPDRLLLLWIPQSNVWTRYQTILLCSWVCILELGRDFTCITIYHLTNQSSPSARSVFWSDSSPCLYNFYLPS